MALRIAAHVILPATFGYSIEATATAYDHETLEDVALTALHDDEADSFPELEELPEDVQNIVLTALYVAASGG